MSVNDSNFHVNDVLLFSGAESLFVFLITLYFVIHLSVHLQKDV